MIRPLLHIAQEMFDSPLAIMPEKLDAILRAVGPRLTVDQAALDSLLESGILVNRRSYADLVAFGDMDENPRRSDKDDKPYKITDTGIAIIPISGVLMKKGGWMSALSGCSSYEQIGKALNCALDDNDVRAILFDVNSPGGTTHGCFELSEQIYNYRGTKPMWAIANDLAASAAYALASAADRLYLTRTAAVGSIGVYALHCDQSGLDERMGVKYTFVYAGDKKVDGNPHEKLSKSAKTDIQSEVDREYDMFVAAVSRNRRLDADTVRDTQAGILFGDKAVPVLANKVGTLDSVLEELSSKVLDSGGTLISSRKGRQAGSSELELETGMPAIPPHKTATSTKSWDGPANKRRLKEDQPSKYYRQAYAFQRPNANEHTKSGYTFIHHEVSEGGDVSAANMKGCSSSIGILNGGRGGTVLKGADRKGVYDHVAKHLRDGGEEPAELKGYQEYLEARAAYALENGDLALAQAVIDAAYAELDQTEIDALTGEPVMSLTALQSLMAAAKADAKKGKKKDDLGADDYGKKGKHVKSEEDDEEDEDEEDGKDGEDDGEEEDKEDGKKKKGKKAAATSARRDESEEDDEEEEDDHRAEAESGEGMDDEDDMDDGKKKTGKKGKKALVAMPKRDLGADAIAISELCTLYGQPELAAKYIRAGKTAAWVRNHLANKRSEASSEQPTDSFFGVARTGSDPLIRLHQEARQAVALAKQHNLDVKPSEAFEAAINANPDLYLAQKQERELAGLTSFGAQKYLQTARARFKSLGLGVG